LNPADLVLRASEGSDIMHGNDQAIGAGGHVLRARCFVALTFLAVCAAGEGVKAQTEPSAIEYRTLSWFGLLTEDAEVARSFYSDLFGWEAQRTAPGKYLLFHEGNLMGGITEIQRSEPDVDESTWLLGISVPDVRASVTEARRLGGRVLADVSEAQGLGEWAVLEDPQQAQVLLFTPEIPVGPPGGNGSWVWAEVWTRDVDASLEFYSGVVGWEGGTWDRPDGEYPVFLWEDQIRGGLVPIEEEGWVPGWAPYIGVADLRATLGRARSLGGTVLFDPAPEIDEGLVAALTDPTGVGFLVYQLPEAER